MEVVRELSGAIQGAPNLMIENWSAAELDPRVASLDPGRHRLSGRECILAETLCRRGNRVVTNEQFGRWSPGLELMLVRNSCRAGIEQTIQNTSPMFAANDSHWARAI